MKRKTKSVKKDYYAMYLPSENEEIQVGDHFSSPKSGTNMYPADRIEDGVIYTKNPHGQKKFSIEKEGLKKSIMFLCSKKLREGVAFDKSAGWCSISKIFDTVANVHYADCKLSRPHSSLISVVGEISPEVVWIKHGDKIALEDIKRHTKEEIESQDGFYKEGVNDIILFGADNRVQIKCPTCKSYH